MARFHRRVALLLVTGAVLVGAAWALLGIGLAVMVAVGLMIAAIVWLPAVVVLEEETHLPSWRETGEGDKDHGYHPAR